MEKSKIKKEEAMPATTSSGPIISADPSSPEAVFTPTRQSLTKNKDKKKMEKSKVKSICDKVLSESNGGLTAILESVENSDGAILETGKVSMIAESVEEQEAKIIEEAKKKKDEDGKEIVKEAKKDEDEETIKEASEEVVDEAKKDDEEKVDDVKEATPKELKDALMKLIDAADAAKAILGLGDAVEKVEEFEEEFMDEKKETDEETISEAGGDDLKARIRKHLEKKSTMKEKVSQRKRRQVIKEARTRIKNRKLKNINESSKRKNTAKLIKESLKKRLANKK